MQFNKRSFFIIALYLLGMNRVVGQVATPLESALIQQCIDRVAAGDHTRDDLRSWQIISRQADERAGRIIFHVQQVIDSIPVYGVVHAIAVRGEQSYALPLTFIPDLKSKVNTRSPSLTPLQGLESALRHLNLERKPILKAEQSPDSKNTFFTIDGEILNRPARVRLCLQPWKQMVRLAWDVNLDVKGVGHWWNIRIDAVTGVVIGEDDWVVACTHNTEDFAGPSPAPPGPTPLTAAQYTAFPLPVESPIHGSRQTLTDPAIAPPSPYGWHDTNGSTGAEYTITRGNNVYAYEDANNDDLPGYSPDGGSTLQFNFPFHIDSSASANRNASLTNLFYISNVIHDILWKNGFDEQSGNFQFNNYGRGGLGDDQVMAEGLDGGGTNNANFATPDDGTPPRMQMYLWNGGGSASCSSFEVLSPPAIAGNKTIGFALYNPVQLFNITSNLVLANDGVGTLTDGCSAYANAASVAGKIVVVDRGTCSFLDKTFYAQQAGAVGVLIVNNVTSSTPPTLSGTAAYTVTIPTLSLLQSEGSAIKSQLNAGTTVSGRLIYCPPGAPRDGSFDNGIVAHEYGHGLSNRLTGGPAASSCLSNAEQGGEGWSDWLALITTIEPGDQGSNARGIGTFATTQPVSGGGIRRYPYSTNMSINPQTYANLGTSTSVHQRGEIWCDAIWDMTWFLIRDFGFNSSLSASGDDSSGNIVAMRLVLEGMKLQPCSPGYIDARDAILLADDILYSSAHRCQIWEAFSRRGMGYFAAQGSSNAVGDETVDFTYPPFCLPATVPPVAGFSANTLTATCPGTIRFSDQSAGNPQQWQWNFGDGTTSTRQNPEHTYAQPGSYTVKLKVNNTLGGDSLEQIAYITITGFNVQVSTASSPVCAGDTVQLNANIIGSNAVAGYTVTGIPYAPLSATGTTTTVSLPDDGVSSLQPIGFTFRFFGEAMNTFALSSNGFIGFSSALANGCCTGQNIPSISAPNGVIALAWNDLNPSANASIVEHFLVGTAPGRKRVIRYVTNHYNGTAYPMRGQIVLHEGSDVIEIHAESVTAVPGNPTTMGIENSAGNKAFYPPGRNASVFSAASESWRFQPYVDFGYAWSEPMSSWVDSLASPSIPAQFPDTVSVVVTDANGCTSVGALALPVNLCADSADVNITLYVQGYLSGNPLMNPVLYNTGLSNDPTVCDSVSVAFHAPEAPYALLFSSTGLLRTNGSLALKVPAALFAQYTYLVIRTRNGVATWSKTPQRVSAVTMFDFTQ